MTKTSKILKFQIWHLISLLSLIFVIKFFLYRNPEILSGAFWSINTEIWFWLAIITPIIHQIYVFLVWRFELYQKTFTKLLGDKRAFTLYAIGFSILFAGRLVTIIFLSISNRDTLQVNPIITYSLAALITPIVLYLFYSVKKYFTVERAYGIDHFVVNYNKPYVKKGIFKYTNNGMYLFGLMILYLPGLLLLSKVALLVALFNHIYIWVHFFFTEKPDMIEIYENRGRK